jgi:hypothetical protein
MLYFEFLLAAGLRRGPLWQLVEGYFRPCFQGGRMGCEDVHMVDLEDLEGSWSREDLEAPSSQAAPSLGDGGGVSPFAAPDKGGAGAACVRGADQCGSGPPPAAEAKVVHMGGIFLNSACQTAPRLSGY